MDKEIKIRMQSSIEGFHLPRYREIPDVGLLLEQSMRLVNSYVEQLGDVKLTSSMISNYVKQKIIDRPVRKMYNRDQLADLIFIAIAKTVLPLEDIRQLLELQRRSYSVQEAYNYFCEEFEKTLTEIFSGNQAGETEKEGEPSGRSLLNYLIVTASHRILLERYIRQILDTEAGEEKAE